ncbi:unnamed protein product, partial [Gongylonema pulchrum]|uniref:TPX2 domain-containing protein n=1 Tax=Gongylonema pulchrum TaxID=637853 RepID=A0A183EPV6_9BILA
MILVFFRKKRDLVQSEKVFKANVATLPVAKTPTRTPVRIATPRAALTPKAAPSQATNAGKRSEIIRKMEKRANIVMKNKEELMKEKAERAKRGYYNRMQKQPMIRAVSSQDIAGIVVGPSDQKEERFRGKRGCSGAEKQDVANKRQKHDGSGPSETKSSVARKTRSKTPQTTVTTVTVGVDAREAMANKEASMNSLQFEEAQNEEAVQTGWSLCSKVDSLDEMGKIAEKNVITPTEVRKSTPCPPRKKSTGSLPKTRVAAKSVRSFAEQQKKPAQNGFD